MSALVLIPAFRPDQRLVELVRDLRGTALDVVVVDDGSGPGYAPVFAAVRAAGATVLRHRENRGKGRALKTGLTHVGRHRPGVAVVCADADGQHSAPDVLRVAAAITDPATLVLGGRRFTGPVPARSRIGNGVVRALVRAVTGLRVHDTQTGLRGVPAAMVGWLAEVPGERYEFEMRALLDLGPAGYAVREVEVATIYLEDNAGSHFRPVVDSVRVLAPVLGFAAASLVGFAVDTVALLLLVPATGSLGLGLVGARVLSGSANFAVNRWVTFRAGRRAPLRRAVAAYLALAVGVLGAGYLGLSALTALGLPLLTAKVVTDLAVWAVSYRVARGAVFRAPARAAAPVPAGARVSGRVR